jgi:hypothetical protein
VLSFTEVNIIDLVTGTGERLQVGCKNDDDDDDDNDDDDDDDDNDDDEDNNEPVWPTWAVGALFRSRSSTYSYQPRMFSHNPVMEDSGLNMKIWKR